MLCSTVSCQFLRARYNVRIVGDWWEQRCRDGVPAANSQYTTFIYLFIMRLSCCRLPIMQRWLLQGHYRLWQLWAMQHVCVNLTCDLWYLLWQWVLPFLVS